MRQFLLIVGLGAARAFLKGGGGGATCAADGGSSVYIETIDVSGSVDVRRIQFSGCPNHESYCTGKPGRSCGDEGKTSTLVEGTEQCEEVEVPANPKLNDSSPDPKELDCTMGTIAYALNGVGFFSGAVSYVRGGDCPQLDVSDSEAEWISFDCCTGHSTGDGLYHYHFPPSCLLAQAEADAPMGSTVANGHSPQVGWAQDGFPIYGPYGPEGTLIQNCGSAGAHATYCQDECGGLEMELDGVDEYKYRYYITGEVGDLNSLPSNPKPDSEALYFPYTIRCHRGATVDEYNSLSGTTDGYTTAHKAEAHLGYSSKINPVKCLDGKEKTEYDWLALKATTEAVCNFDGAASATVARLALVAAGLVAML